MLQELTAQGPRRLKKTSGEPHRFEGARCGACRTEKGASAEPPRRGDWPLHSFMLGRYLRTLKLLSQGDRLVGNVPPNKINPGMAPMVLGQLRSALSSSR